MNRQLKVTFLKFMKDVRSRFAVTVARLISTQEHDDIINSNPHYCDDKPVIIRVDNYDKNHPLNLIGWFCIYCPTFENR